MFRLSYPKNKFKFVLLLWGLSRLLIFVIMLLVTPAFAPRIWNDILSLAVLTHWDGVWYQQIATTGYHYVADGKAHPVAFFPLFPLISRGIMTFGLPFAIAGALVNNLAFLGALLVIYDWMQERYEVEIARWTIAILVWCPLSLYVSVTYTEGLFLLLSSLALRAFEQRRYRQAALFGALTTATRLPGILLVPTFLIVAWKEKRAWVAYLVVLVTASGFLAYSSYCAIRFGDPLVFIHIQRAFGQRAAAGFDSFHWGHTFLYGIVGRFDGNTGMLKNPLQPIQVALIGGAGALLWQNRTRLRTSLFVLANTSLILGWWLLWGDGLIKVAMVFGGGYLLWHWRKQLSLTVLTYGVGSLLLVLFSGAVGSNDRYTYGSVAWSISMGLLLAQYQPWSLSILAFCGIVLSIFASQFALNMWIS
jgi:Gpi18-like mannosyltransferase